MSQRIHTLQTTSDLDFPIEEVFEFFSNATNLERITPPELSFRILTPLPIEMRDGARIDYELSLFHIPFRWKTEIASWRPNERFVDEQLSGPFRLWHHTHEFRESTRGTRMMDTVRYSLPLAPVGELALPLIRRQLEKIFNYRSEVIPHEIAERVRAKA